MIPHNQTSLPGPALSPAEAVAKMTVPDGFEVEVVASEPDIVNPVAMTLDERGRFWITESFEYPRREPGPGRDRIKVLEDTDRDGKIDKVTIFAEGLNIPSGIAVGHGGVWVANSPDILFLQDTDGDGRADHQEIVVTGFGRDDTHELPNSLTWGPDGWLYGLNGVFNRSVVQQGEREFDFTCALFRIHPRTREFQLFCEGTSNPWGVAFDANGSAFISACVIDHLWHLTESGYYHRQGGPYPPHTWKINSIVEHKHQMAAYCGITYFDSDAYPAEYREKLYMGNIHGNCINTDYLSRNGSTYAGHGDPDFLSAHDAWFMPVVQKTGPDGCLYILDWYDRYHCYQDANRDPAGIDRGRGRLYRVRYKNTPRAVPFDLTKESDEQLIERLSSPNVYYRDLAQRLLAERNTPAIRQALESLVLNPSKSRKARMHGLWSLVSGGPLSESLQLKLLAHDDPTFRAWGVRAAGNQGRVAATVQNRIVALADDEAPDVRLQVAIAANKLTDIDSLELLCRVLSHPAADPILPQIVWRNMLPHLEDGSVAFLQQLAQIKTPSTGWNQLLPHAVRRLASNPAESLIIGKLLTQILPNPAWTVRNECLASVRETLIQNPTWQQQRIDVRDTLLPTLKSQIYREGPAQPDPSHAEAILLAALLGDEPAAAMAATWLTDETVPTALRLQTFATLTSQQDPRTLDAADKLLTRIEANSATFTSLGGADGVGGILAALGRLADARVATVVLSHYATSPAEIQPRMIELLTQRSDWSQPLLKAIAEKQLPSDALHINQVRRLQNSHDAAVVALVRQIWGQVREGRNPEVEKAVQQVRNWVKDMPGDATRGHAVFKKTCAQCHQIYGEGEQVGPDITRNGRSSYDQLLSNVFDPNLVIGADYQARTLVTTDGRTLSGLLVEDSPERVVLKLQGGKQEVVARADIDELAVSPLSLMPEGWEKQLPVQEVVDLIHFLTLDGPPSKSDSQRLPGTPIQQ